MPRLVLIPGLGMGAALYPPQRLLPARVEIVPWLQTAVGESLRDYGRRLAATIDPGEDLYVGGMSFGGMLALEAAAALVPRPRGVFLIAAARDGRALSPLVQMTCRFAAPMPPWLYAKSLLAAPLLVRMVGRPDRIERRWLLDLAARSLPSVTQWGCSAMRNWKAPSDLGCPIHQIHGALDHMIPLSRLRPRPDVVIPHGGHVIHLTHAAEVNSFIAQRLGGG